MKMNTLHHKVIASLLLSVFTMLFFSQTSLANTENVFWEGSIYVKVKEEAQLSLPNFDLQKSKAANYPHLSQLIQQHQITKIYKPLRRLKTPFFENLYKIEFNDSLNVKQLRQSLKQFDFVEFSEKQQKYSSTAVPNDPGVSKGDLWFLETVSAFGAWDLTKGSSDIVVAVVDDAVKITHEDLKPNVWINTKEISNNNIDDDGNGYVDDRVGWDGAFDDNNPMPPASANRNSFSHGTHVAGTAAAATNNGRGIASLAHNVKLMACKAGNSQGLYGVYEALEYAIINRPHVINCSWGGSSSSSILENLIDEAEARDIVIVAASGNENTSKPSFPAGYDYVISVASSERGDKRSSFSNYGTTIDITAPGSDIVSCLVSGTTSYYSNYGTSMASPNVASLVALMFSKNPTATSEDIKSCLYSSADNIDNKNPNFKGLLGAGRINARAAVECIGGGGNAACPKPTNLSVANITGTSAQLTWNQAAGADKYDIQIRLKNGGTWTNLPNSPVSTNSYQISNLQSSTPYQFRVKSKCDTKSSTYAAPFEFSTSSSGNTSSYCTAKGNNAQYEWIESFEMGTINNKSGNNDGYGNFTNLTTNLKPNNSYNFTLTPGLSNVATEYLVIWIDYNQDGDFEDSGEKIYDSQGSFIGIVSKSVVIPVTAKIGKTRMRVAMKYVGPLADGEVDNDPPESCGIFGYGEVEDYMVDINDAVSGGPGETSEYCNNEGGDTADEWIETVTLGDINNTSGNNGGYFSFLNNSTNLKQGESYNFMLTPGYASENYTRLWRIWVDYNSDGDFNDTGELVFDSPEPSKDPVNGTFSVPSTATKGSTRIRIAMKFVGTVGGQNDSDPPSACSGFAYGEVEDYTAIITDSDTTPPTDDYCNAAGNDTADEWIEQVQFANINNTSGNNNGYGDYSNLTANVEAGSTYNFTLTPKFKAEAFTERWRIWIDFNRDGDFKDTGELVFDPENPSKVAIQNTLQIPVNVPIGVTRMRIAMKFVGLVGGVEDITVPNDCGTFPYGEVEDYTLNIIEATGACAVPNGLAANNSQSNEATNLVWNAVGGASAYDVRVREVGQNEWISGTVEKLSAELTGILPCTDYEFQVRAICSSGNSNYSPLFQFKSSGCSQTACARPTNLQVNNASESTINLSWQAVTGASQYRVSYRNVGSFTWQTQTINNPTVNLNNLASCVNYECKVQTVCNGSESNFTEILKVTTECSPCAAPNNIRAVGVTPTSATIMWDTPLSANTYQFRARAVGNNDWEGGELDDMGAFYFDLSPCTEYEVQLKTNCDDEQSNFSSSFKFFTEGCESLSHCTSQGEFSDQEWINYVRVADINNTSGNDFGYANFKNISTNLVQEEEYYITLSPGFADEKYPEYWRVWIDFNQDGDFEDLGELVFDAGEASTETINGNITIPATAKLGDTKMRISMKWFDQASDAGVPAPCTVFGYGEVEDYKVTINWPVGLDPIDLVEEIRVGPNPNNGQFSVQVNLNEPSDIAFEVYNIAGQAIYQYQMSSPQSDLVHRIDISDLPTGIYILKTKVGTEVHQQKLVIRN